MKRVFSFLMAVMTAFVLTAEVQAQTYRVEFAPTVHSTLSATLNGADFSGGTVNLGDELEVLYTALPGWRFVDNDEVTIGDKTTLTVGMFDSEGVFYLPEPDTYIPNPELFIKLQSATSALITWSPQAYTSFRLWVSAVELSGNPATWKGAILTTDSKYEVKDLAEGRTYYVYLEGAYEGTVSDMISMTFTAQEPGDPCTYTIDMKDSYGDGWNGCGLRIIEAGKETFITLQNGLKGTASYVSDGFPVKIIWKEDSYPDEISFTIKNGDGIAIFDVEDASVFSDDQVLFEGYLCGPRCAATVGNLEWTVNSAGTQYIVTWESENSVSYEVAVFQKSEPTKEELNKAAVAVSAKQYQFTGKKHGYYNVFVRGVCSDGDKGMWNNILVCNKITLVESTDLKSIAETITLDYVERGELMENAIGLDEGYGDPYPLRAYHLVLEDSTEVNFTMMSADIDAFMFALYQDTLVGKPLAFITNFPNGALKLKGDFYIMFETDRQFGNYILNIKSLKEFVFKPVTNPFSDKGDFTKVGDFAPWGSAAYPAVGYKFTPSDTIALRFLTESSNKTSDVGIFIFKNSPESSNMLTGQPVGYPFVGEFLKDTTYYVAIIAVGSDVVPEDTYSIRTVVVPLNPDPTVAEFVTLDMAKEDSFTESDWVGELGVNGKAYEFVLKNDTAVAYTLELLGEHAEEEMYQYGVAIYIFKDAIVAGNEIGGMYAADQWFHAENLTGSAAGTHYFVVVNNQYGLDAEYRMSLRAIANPNKLPINATLNVGEGYRSAISNNDKFIKDDGTGSYGDFGAIEAYKVHLEKDKTYKIMAHILPEAYNYYDQFQITIFDPSITYGSFADHMMDLSTDCYDGWEVLTVTPTVTADYTVVFGSAVGHNALADSVVYEFEVAEVTTVLKFVTEQPIQRDNFVASGNFIFNTKVLPNVTLKFHAAPESYIEEFGAFDIAACQFKVGAGDTLFVEFGGDEDAMIHIFEPDAPLSADNPIVINEVPYNYPYEHGFVVNEKADSALYLVIGTFYNVSLTNGAFSLRVATSEKEIAPVVVTPKADKNSISINKGDGVAVAQAELGKLVLTAVNEMGDPVTVLVNNPYLWQIDLDAKTARYEFNDSDLPMGFTFGPLTQYVEVTIEVLQPTEIEAIEGAVKNNTVLKVMREGRVLIITPNGTFDIFGRKVED